LQSSPKISSVSTTESASKLKNGQIATRGEGIKLVAMGVSTGGPPTLQTILSNLPKNFPLPILVVQHISRGFVPGLVHWLNQTTSLRCKIAEAGETLQDGWVYIAPDDQHLVVKTPQQTWLETTRPEKKHRPSVDVLFESVAEAYGSAAIGILLTGMGGDGAHGLLRMHKAGAYTIAQDEASSVVFGMSKAAIDLGAVDEILALENIAPRLLMLACTKMV
jgi:two-component system chemotaxis response regulator CheB